MDIQNALHALVFLFWLKRYLTTSLLMIDLSLYSTLASEKTNVAIFRYWIEGLTWALAGVHAWLNTRIVSMLYVITWEGGGGGGDGITNTNNYLNDCVWI